MRKLMHNLGDLSGLDIALAGCRPGFDHADEAPPAPGGSHTLLVRLAAWTGVAERYAGRCPGRAPSLAGTKARPASVRCPATQA